MTDKLWTREFVGMGMANFFYFISHWILVAALPIFIMDDLGKSQVEAGMALTFFQFGTTCCRPFAGRMIDGMHKQHVLSGASFILFLIMVGFGFAKSLEMVWGLRFIHGIIFALGTTSAATLASLILPLSRKGEGIGYFAVTANLAMVIGPLVGLLILNHLGKSCLLIFLALLALSAVFSGNSKKLPESVVRPSGKVKKGFHISDFIERKALPSVILGGLVFFAYGGVLTFVPMYARSLGMGGLSSLFFMTFAVVIVLTRPLVGYLYDHHGPDAVIYPGLVLFSLGLVLFSLWNGPVLACHIFCPSGHRLRRPFAKPPDPGRPVRASLPGRRGHVHLFLVPGYFHRPCRSRPGPCGERTGLLPHVSLHLPSGGNHCFDLLFPVEEK